MARTVPRAIFFVALTLTPMSATILTFDGFPFSNSIISNYGSNMTGLCSGSGQPGCVLQGNGFTPNIAVSYFTPNADQPNIMHSWDTTYGDLVNVAYHDNASVGEIILTPQNGRGVRLNSFDLGGWPLTDYPNQPIQILDGNLNVLADFSGTVRGAGPSHSHFDVGVTRNGELRILFGNNFGIGIDNIDFDEVLPVEGVPEPSSFLLLASGLGLGALLRLRRASERLMCNHPQEHR
jgi:hypothetical protein